MQDPAATKVDLRSRLPEKLSPSRVQDFIQCPKLFFYKTICKMRTPATPATTKGTLAHYALEKIFDLAREERTPENAVPFVRGHWSELESKPDYAEITASGKEAVEQMLVEAEELVRRYFLIENPQSFDPVAREEWVRGKVGTMKMHGIVDRLDLVEVEGVKHYAISDYKGLALDTPIATPSGWSTMGELRVGEYVFGANGELAQVSVKSEVHDRKCYVIGFDDGSEIVCDDEHLWEVEIRTSDGWESTLLDAHSIFEGFVKLGVGAGTMRIMNAAALVMPSVDSEVAPYALGYTLGRQIAERQERRTSPRENVVSLLRGSMTQRQELLRGILSGAGERKNPSRHFDARYQRHHFSLLSSNKTLAELVHELAVSLGLRAQIKQQQSPSIIATMRGEPDYLVTGWFDDRAVSTEGDWEVISGARIGHRVIVKVEAVEGVSTQCIQVDSADSLYLAGKQMVPTHNTGKVPNPKYIDKSFFGMNIYAALAEESLGVKPELLRLVYVKNGSKQDVFKQPVTEASLAKTRSMMNTTNKQIQAAARAGEFLPKKNNLCGWCSFQDICPAWHPELKDIPIEELGERLHLAPVAMLDTVELEGEA
jgi:RecB family exonuclease